MSLQRLAASGRPEGPSSAEGESIGLHAGIEEADFEGVIRNRSLRTHELIQALRRHDAISIGIGVHAMCVAGRLAVDGDAEADVVSRRGWAEHQMQVARMEAVEDAAIRRVELRAFLSDRPFSGQ